MHSAIVGPVPRWEPDAVGRLQTAAFELFAEQGYERTTIAEITRRAGLAQRTFFNHFVDKREVLFGLSADLQRLIVDEIVACASTVQPLAAVVGAFQVAADTMFEQRRVAVVQRRAIIDANPELQERELAKRAALTDAIAAELLAKGLDAETAFLTAGVGMLVEEMAVRRWLHPAETRPLRELLAAASSSLSASLLTDGQTARSSS